MKGLSYKCARYFAVGFRRIACSFHYVVIDVNARPCSWTQNEIIASKTELPVKKLNSAFLHNSVLLITLSWYITLRKGIHRSCDAVKYMIISALVLM